MVLRRFLYALGVFHLWTEPGVEQWFVGDSAGVAGMCLQSAMPSPAAAGCPASDASCR